MSEAKNSFSAPAILLALLLITIFGVTILPQSWYSVAYRSVLIFTLVAVIFSLQKRYRQPTYYLVAVLLVLLILTFIFDSAALDVVSKLTNAFFFLFVVLQLLIQISSSRVVVRGMITQAVNGYLLLGVVFSIFLSGINEIQPGAFSFSDDSRGPFFSNFYNYLYFGFATMGTVGYGDLVPKTPFAKSFSSLIGVTGQLYIALVIALLVGKYASQARNENQRPG